MAEIVDEYLKGVSEEEIKEMFKNYIPQEEYDKFIEENKREITKIRYGNPTNVLNLKNFKTGIIYQARINGVKRKTSEYGKYNYFSCFYKLPKLQLAKTISIGEFKYDFSEEEINELMDKRRLNTKITMHKDTGEFIERFVAIDDELNRMAFMPVKAFKAPDKIKDQQLTEQQKSELEEGKRIEFIYKINIEDTHSIKALINYDPVSASIKFGRLSKVSDVKTELVDLTKTKTAVKENIDQNKVVEKTEFSKNNQNELKNSKQTADKKQNKRINNHTIKH